MLTGPALLALGFTAGAGASSAAGREVRLATLSVAPPAAVDPVPRISVVPPTGATSVTGSNRWSGVDWGLEGLFAAAMAGDYLQTLHTAQSGYVEANPLLGRHPAPVVTTAYFLATAAAHAAVARVLPRPWRTIWQVGGIVVQGLTIRDNLRAGVGFTF